MQFSELLSLRQDIEIEIYSAEASDDQGPYYKSKIKFEPILR